VKNDLSPYINYLNKIQKKLFDWSIFLSDHYHYGKEWMITLIWEENYLSKKKSVTKKIKTQHLSFDKFFSSKNAFIDLTICSNYSNNIYVENFVSVICIYFIWMKKVFVNYPLLSLFMIYIWTWWLSYLSNYMSMIIKR